ncbi:hypothetical protein [Streptomyces leeuwenhoekii]|uniref:hypothetical protein n=1 Tax=Streptomyces leeuwenhoekii TaxID=1437453 RepID=UPI00069DF03A|nr:hypothetical protein [Streptomyces leeuwenhoekii]
MNPGSTLFSNGDLASTLDRQLSRISNAVAGLNENSLLTVPEQDICDSLQEKYLIDPVVLDRDGVTIDSIEDGYTTVRQFGEEARIRQTAVTVSVPFSGEPSLLNLKPSTFTYSPPQATVGDWELKIYWTGPLNSDPAAVRKGIDEQLDTIEKWLSWSLTQLNAYNATVRERILTEVRARKERVLSMRNLQASIGFPLRQRSDAATYSVPITRKKIVPRTTRSATESFRPEPALEEAQYEAALAVLRNQRNQLERNPSTSAHLGEEQIRDLLLIGLNSQFEGRAAGEVFNKNGKTDILIREQDRHVFIGECKIWRGPKTIPDTLDQLLGYLVWRDTKAALLLFIQAASPADAIAKAIVKFREHPNYKRDGRHATEERHDFVFHANGDSNREIKLAFLPFHLPKEPHG